MYSTGWTKSRRALDCFFSIRLWLKFRDGIDEYWVVPVRKLFCFHHCYQSHKLGSALVLFGISLLQCIYFQNTGFRH